MYSCYIIDDETHSIDAMSRYVERIPDLKFIGSSSEPKIGVSEILHGQRPHILLLDVEMPGLSGIDVVKLIPKEVSIIFITGHSQFAYQAYEHDVLDYLLKPVTFDRFSKSIEKVIANIRNARPSNHFLIIHGKRGQVIQLKIEEILFIEALDHIMHITSTTGVYRYKTTMNEVLKALGKNNFLKTHRSFIVNLTFIQAIENNMLIMSNDAKIPISRGSKKTILDKLKGF